MFINKLIRGTIIKGRNDTFDPPTEQSNRWKQWMTERDFRVCEDCTSMQGKIYDLWETANPPLPLHSNCRCQITVMCSVAAGYATRDGIDGADWWIKHYGRLPDYYISLDNIESLGYRHGKPPRKYAPGKMIFGGVYRNENGHLPVAPGRVWYEADINYYEGHRNKHRIVWSNDGLIFVTYDHYHTFYEII